MSYNDKHTLGARTLQEAISGNEEVLKNMYAYIWKICFFEKNNQLKKIQIFRNMTTNSLRFINTYKDSAYRQTLFLYKLCILLSIKENKVDIIERDILLNDFSGGKNLKLLEELQNYYKKNKIKEITDGDISDLIIHQMKEQNIDYDKEDTIKILKNQTEINADQTVVKSTLNTPRPTRTDSIRKSLNSPQNKQILSQTPKSEVSSSRIKTLKSKIPTRQKTKRSASVICNQNCIIHQMKEQNIDYDKEDTIKILKNQTEINIDQTVIKSTLNTPRSTRTDSIRKSLNSPQNNIKLGTNKTRSASVAHNQNKQILSQTPQPKKTNIVNNEIEQLISQTPQPKTMSIVGANIQKMNENSKVADEMVKMVDEAVKDPKKIEDIIKYIYNNEGANAEVLYNIAKQCKTKIKPGISSIYYIDFCIMINNLAIYKCNEKIKNSIENSIETNKYKEIEQNIIKEMVGELKSKILVSIKNKERNGYLLKIIYDKILDKACLFKDKNEHLEFFTKQLDLMKKNTNFVDHNYRKKIQENSKELLMPTLEVIIEEFNDIINTSSKSQQNR